MEPLFRDLFCRLYRCQAPVVRLADIVHWAAIVRGLGLGGLSLHEHRAYVPGGYFYAVHTPAPDAQEVRAALGAAELHEAAVLYPVVRRDGGAAALRDAGFTALPWFVEAEYHVREGVDEDLREQLGGRRLRVLKRLARRAGERFELRVMIGDELAREPGTLRAFDYVHRLNLEKYGHRHNHFSPAVLELLVDSALRSRLCLFVRTARGETKPVQAILALLASDGRRVELLVQGIDHRRVPPEQNLYSSALYEIYEWGVDRGIEVFGLGRGAERRKLDLGANTFHLLDNHLAPSLGQGRDELETLRQAAAAHFESILTDLADTARRRGAAGLVTLPAELEQAPCV